MDEFEAWREHLMEDSAQGEDDLIAPKTAVEATEEAIYNALLQATTIEGRGNRLEAIPLDKTINILKEYNVLHWDKSLPPGNQSAK